MENIKKRKSVWRYTGVSFISNFFKHWMDKVFLPETSLLQNLKEKVDIAQLEEFQENVSIINNRFFICLSFFEDFKNYTNNLPQFYLTSLDTHLAIDEFNSLRNLQDFLLNLDVYLKNLKLLIKISRLFLNL